VYVPRSVQRELNRKGRFRYRLNRLYQTGFFARCWAADATNVLLLRNELDEGESEAIIQGQEKQARFFIGDDKRAREIAERMGRQPVGTLRLLARLHLEGRAPEVWSSVQKLREDLDFRVSDSVDQHAIDLSAEPI